MQQSSQRSTAGAPTASPQRVAAAAAAKRTVATSAAAAAPATAAAPAEVGHTPSTATGQRASPAAARACELRTAQLLQGSQLVAAGSRQQGVSPVPTPHTNHLRAAAVPLPTPQQAAPKDAPRPIFRKDYEPPPYWVDTGVVTTALA
jgi:hypothetical protein